MNQLLLSRFDGWIASLDSTFGWVIRDKTDLILNDKSVDIDPESLIKNFFLQNIPSNSSDFRSKSWRDHMVDFSKKTSKPQKCKASFMIFFTAF